MDRQTQWSLLLAFTAIGFLVALAFGPRRSADPQQEQELANAQSELQIARDRVGQLESELSEPTRERADKAGAPAPSAPTPEQKTEPEPQPEPQAQAAPPPEPEPQAAPEPHREARRELTPEEVLRREEPPRAAPVERSEPAEVALAEPQGSDSVYADPDPAAPVIRSDVAALQVLTPERAGWTTQAQPALYWHASQGMPSPGEFTLTREGEEEPVLRARLQAPDGPGIQRIELSQSSVSLEEGATYRWTISFADDRATGGIRRVAPPEALRATGPAPVAERLDALERAGLWYDALDLVTRSIEDNSGARNLVARRSAMFARARLYLP